MFSYTYLTNYTLISKKKHNDPIIHFWLIYIHENAEIAITK